MQIRKALIVVGIVLSLFSASTAFSYESLGKPEGFVNDYLGVLNSLEIKSLESQVQDFEKKTGNEISVVIIQSLNGDTIENFAEKLFKEWGIGKADKDNGVLLLVAFNDHKLRIEVGYGLESTLTDAQASQIIEKVIKPYFKTGDYGVGISKGVSAIMASIDGNYADYEKIINSSTNHANNVNFQNNNDDESSLADTIMIWAQVLFWVFLFLGQLVISILARSKSWWLGGIVGGIIALVAAIILTSINVLIYFGAILVPLGLAFDYWASSTYRKYKALNKNPPWFAGGTWANSGGGFSSRSSSSSWSSSSSSGGSSFGGGSSGGGGASGSW